MGCNLPSHKFNHHEVTVVITVTAITVVKPRLTEQPLTRPVHCQAFYGRSFWSSQQPAGLVVAHQGLDEEDGAHRADAAGPMLEGLTGIELRCSP